MVLERLVSDDWLEKKFHYAFFFAISHSIIGICFAKLLFPSDPALVAVAFTSILLLPTISKVFDREEREAKANKKFMISGFWRDESDFIKFYLAILAGVFLVYTLASALLPAFQVGYLFQSQLELRGASGGAVSSSLFSALLKNNAIFLIATFMIALLSGDGAIFLLIWNVSVWGTIFGVTARNAAFFSGHNPIYYLALVLMIALPHAFLEIMSYILGAMGGGMISKDLVIENGERKSDRFGVVFYRYVLLIGIGALIFLIAGALIEAWVLTNVETYRQIIIQSYGV